MLNPYEKYDKKTLELMKDSGFRTEGGGLHEVFLKQSKKSYERALKESQQENFDEEISGELKKLRNEADPLLKWKTLLKYSDPEIQLNENVKYLKLSCLIKLRNTIAHRNARLLSANSFPKEFAPCIRQKIIPEPTEFRGSWLLTILNPEIAKWAYCVAKEWLEWSKDYVTVNEKDI